MKRFILLASTVLLSGAVIMASAGQHDGESDATNMNEATYQAKHQHHGKKGHRRGHQHRFKRALAKLDLSDSQKQDIKALMSAAHEDMKPLRMAAHENRKALRDMAGADDLDMELAEVLATEQGDLVAQIALQRVKTHHAVLAMLNDDQRGQLSEMRAERKAKRAARQG